MNKFNKIFLSIAAVGSLYTLTACVEKDFDGKAPGQGKRYLDGVSVSMAPATRDGDDITDPVIPDGEFQPDGEFSDNYLATELLQDQFQGPDKTNPSWLYFTQFVPGKLQPFVPIKKGDDTKVYWDKMSETMLEKYPEEYPNVYKYYYEDRYPANYYDVPATYNFFPSSAEEKMDWDVVKFWGRNSSLYTIYSIFYPYNNLFPYNSDGNPDFKVQEDQTTIDNLRKSNFLGGYFADSNTDQDLKFHMYHLLSYLKVTLYIPTYNPNDKELVNGKEVTVRTGYPADAIQKAELVDVMNNFSITWNTNKTSGQAPTTSATPGSTRTNILMYVPEPDYYKNNPDGLPPKVMVPTSYFYPPTDSRYDPDEEDECWEITVHALIPAGQDYPRNDEKFPNGMTWTYTNFLQLYMRQNLGNYKRYYFNGNPDPRQGGGMITNGTLTIAQGVMQHISLYLPRHGEAAILLGAKVIDWEEAYNNNMGLRQEDPDPATEPEPEPEPTPNPDSGN